MKKEGAKPADKPVDYSALKDITYSVFEDKFKDNYFKIISGEGRVEYSAKVIDLCHDKIKLNLADGTEKKIVIGYIHSVIPIEKPSDFKQISLRTENARKRKPRKKKEAIDKAESEKKDDDEEKDEENDNLEGLVSKEE